MLQLADLFCGAGGTSTGALQALSGRAVQLVAINHWDVAIATHTLNHPEVEHFCSNVYQLSPHEAVPGGTLDLLMASPTCTYYSRARSGKPISRQQKYGRMTPTQVVRWCSELEVNALLVENVPEFENWGPVHISEPTQKRCRARSCRVNQPCKARAGSYFRAWIRKLQRLGFQLEWKTLCSADYGDATTRKRIYVLGRRDGKPITWPAPTHSKEPQAATLFAPATKRWRAAREIIDWSHLGKSIFTRKKPLSAKTLARIYTGAVRFSWPKAHLDRLTAHMIEVGAPIPKVKGPRAPLEPFVLSQASGGAPRPVSQPIPTLATDCAHAFVTPYYGRSTARSVDQPLPTSTTKARFGFLVPAFGERPGQTPRVHSLEEPVPTICATGRVNLATAHLEAEILFRMLQPNELAASMGFTDYTFTGTKGDVNMQIGNAVSVNTASALVAAQL